MVVVSSFPRRHWEPGKPLQVEDLEGEMSPDGDVGVAGGLSR